MAIHSHDYGLYFNIFSPFNLGNDLNKTYILIGALILSLIFNTFQYFQHTKDQAKIAKLENPVIRDSSVTYQKDVHKTESFTKSVPAKKVDKPTVRKFRTVKPSTQTEISIDTLTEIPDTLINHETFGKDTLTVVEERGLYNVTLKHSIEQVIKEVMVPVDVPFFEKPYFNFILGFLTAVFTIIFL